MFSNIIKSSTSTGTYSAIGVLISLGIALLIGLIFAFCYFKQGSPSKNFSVALVMMPTIVGLMILMVSGNLGAGVAVAGTFSLIRFRSAPGSAKDIMLIFLATAAGIACGMGYAFLALAFAILMGAVYLVLTQTRFGEAATTYRELRIMLPENIDYSTVFDGVFEQYTKSSQLVRVRTTNLGSMFDLTYNIKLLDPKKEKEMVDEIRTRNGNLTVVLSRVSTDASAL